MLVSADELRNAMGGVSWNTAERERAEFVLAGVQEELETYLNRPLEPVQIREAVVSDEAGVAYLSVTPVHKIVSVNWIGNYHDIGPQSPEALFVPSPIDRDPLIGDDGRVIDLVGQSYSSFPTPIAGGVFLGGIRGWYVIEYVGGWIGASERGLKNSIIRVARREVENTTNADQLSLRQGNGESATPGDTREIGWTMDELIRWDRLRRRVIV